jgi:hypothetical protein
MRSHQPEPRKTMPYYIYRITPGPTNLTKTLEKLEQHDSFREAKQRARTLRADMDEADNTVIKVMFADTELAAEEALMEKREQPILREWEK